jgi:O-acetyl-ADP-ribose deacetylase (regulator of RNase III)
MRAPRVRVQLGTPEDVQADLVVLPGAHAQSRPDGRTVVICAPRWTMPDGPEHRLAEAYREAMALANARGAHSMVLPAILARGPWPLDEVTRVALTVLHGTPTSVHEVIVVASTPAILERWAEAIARAA